MILEWSHQPHANEVAILPYYVGSLNIEATEAAITGQFAEYPNLCFVDTLDNWQKITRRGLLMRPNSSVIHGIYPQ